MAGTTEDTAIFVPVLMYLCVSSGSPNLIPELKVKNPPVSTEISENVRIAPSMPNVGSGGYSSRAFSEPLGPMYLFSFERSTAAEKVSSVQEPESRVESVKLLDRKSPSTASRDGPSGLESASVKSIATPSFFRSRPAVRRAAFDDSGQSPPPLAKR